MTASTTGSRHAATASFRRTAAPSPRLKRTVNSFHNQRCCKPTHSRRNGTELTHIAPLCPPCDRACESLFHEFRPLARLHTTTSIDLNTTAAQDDYGSSHNLLLKKNISDDWFILSRSNIAFRRENEQLFLGYTGASLGYQFNQQWSGRLGFFVRPTSESATNGGKNNARCWKPTMPKCSMVFASLFSAAPSSASVTGVSDDIRLRQEFSLTAPWKFTPLKLKPYLSNETFYSTRNDWIEANWLDLGLSFFPLGWHKNED